MSADLLARAALIVPALDEEASIGQVLDEIPPGLYFQILVADSGWRDATAAVARSHGATVVHEPRRGYGSACLRAIRSLDPAAEVVVFMDADCSDVPAEAASLIQPIAEDRADLVVGTPTLRASQAGSPATP